MKPTLEETIKRNIIRCFRKDEKLNKHLSKYAIDKYNIAEYAQIAAHYAAIRFTSKSRIKQVAVLLDSHHLWKTKLRLQDPVILITREGNVKYTYHYGLIQVIQNQQIFKSMQHRPSKQHMLDEVLNLLNDAEEVYKKLMENTTNDCPMSAQENNDIVSVRINKLLKQVTEQQKILEKKVANKQEKIFSSIISEYYDHYFVNDKKLLHVTGANGKFYVTKYDLNTRKSWSVHIPLDKNAKTRYEIKQSIHNTIFKHEVYRSISKQKAKQLLLVKGITATIVVDDGDSVNIHRLVLEKMTEMFKSLPNNVPFLVLTDCRKQNDKTHCTITIDFDKVKKSNNYYIKAGRSVYFRPKTGQARKVNLTK